ncbi:MAG: hypothetical protein IJ593_06690 [Lachnospiraceae bacterium]|nr:hypothetical protein [Lachnospiraceae bacterium]
MSRIINFILPLLLLGTVSGCVPSNETVKEAAGGNNLNSQVEVSDTTLNEDDNQNKDDIPAGDEVYTIDENETPVENKNDSLVIFAEASPDTDDTVEEVIVRHSDDDIYIREEDGSIVYLNNWGEFYKYDIKNKTYSYIDSDEYVGEDINGNVVYRDPDGNIYKITPYSEFIWVDADGDEIWIRSTDGSEYRQLPVIDETETENTETENTTSNSNNSNNSNSNKSNYSENVTSNSNNNSSGDNYDDQPLEGQDDIPEIIINVPQGTDPYDGNGGKSNAEFQN